MGAKKTNIDFLRKILDTLGNLMGENNYNESIEFLDGIKSDFDDLENDFDNKKDELSTCETNNRELQSEIQNFHEEAPANKINAGIGYIAWGADNIQLMGIMEALEERLKTTSPNDIAKLLES